MAVPGKTFGDFFDVVYQTKTFEPSAWMDEWKDMVDQNRWEEVRATPLTDDWVACFAEDMATFFRKRMAGICTEELYDSVSKDGRVFLAEITAKAKHFGVDVSAQTGVPVTPTAAVARTSESSI